MSKRDKLTQDAINRAQETLDDPNVSAETKKRIAQAQNGLKQILKSRQARRAKLHQKEGKTRNTPT